MRTSATMLLRTILPVFTAVWLCAVPLQAVAQNPGDVIFAGMQIHDVQLNFSQPGFWDSLRVNYEAGDEKCISATAVLNGVAYANIGVRFKGNSSYTYPTQKKSLRLEFDYFGGNERWDGEKDIHLNNMWGDPSFLREKIHLDFCRDNGIRAPRANYARVTINGTFWGLYSLIEHVDKRFTKTHFGDNNGDMFKAMDAFGPSDTSSIVSDFTWRGPVDTAYYRYYENKTEESATSWPHLIALIDTLTHSTALVEGLEAVMNVTPFLHAVAADVMLGNLDAYYNSGRNFYLYFNPKTGKAEWIMWDVGLSFGAYASGVFRVETLPLLHVGDPNARPLVTRVMEQPEFRSRYLTRVCELASVALDPARMFPHIDSVAALIRASVIDDPNKMYTVAQFETNINSDVQAQGGAGLRKPGLKSFITARRTSILDQLASLGVNCLLSAGNAPAPAAPQLGNYPNPFRTSTSLTFTLERPSNIRLTLTSVLGREIVLEHGVRSAGTHVVPVDAAGLPPGVYQCRLDTDGHASTRMLLKVQ